MTLLLRANSHGEILDADGKVVARVVPVEPTSAMLVDAVKERHGQATYRCVSASGCVTFEREARADYEAMLSAAPTDLSAVAVKVAPCHDLRCHGEFRRGWNAALDALGAGK